MAEKLKSENLGNYSVTLRIVVTAALGALTVFLGITRLGLIPWFSGASLSIMHIPVIIGTILEGPLVGMVTGAIFGVFSLIQANISASGIIDLAFRNPLVAILPRILFPLAGWAVYYFLASMLKKLSPKATLAAVPVSAFVASLVHTAFVLFALAMIIPAKDLLPLDAPEATVPGIMTGIFVANGLPEAIAAAVFVSIVISIWTGVSSRKKSRVSEL